MFVFKSCLDTSVTDMSNASFYETLQLSIWGTRKDVLSNLISKAMDYSLSKDEGKTIIYTGSHDWRY